MPRRDRAQDKASLAEQAGKQGSTQPAPPGDARRDQILTAAERLFAERGYEGVAVRDVAETAGVTHPLIYYYWGSKRGLLAAVLERNQQRVRSLAAQHPEPREAILAIIRNYLSEGEGRLYLLIMARSFLGGMPVSDWPGGYPGMESALDALLKAGPAGDPVWDERARETVAQITAMLCGWVLMGEQIMDVAGVTAERRLLSSDRMLASIDDVLRKTLAMTGSSERAHP